MKGQITASSGNVFSDLGLDAEEAAHLEVRSSLMFIIHKLIQDQGLTQVKAAQLLGVTQPRICDLVRGRIDLFIQHRLARGHARSGWDQSRCQVLPHASARCRVTICGSLAAADTLARRSARTLPRRRCAVAC